MLSIVEYDYNTNFRRLNNDQNVFHNALRYVLKGEKRFHIEGDGYDYDLVYEDNDVRAKKIPPSLTAISFSVRCYTRHIIFMTRTI